MKSNEKGVIMPLEIYFLKYGDEDEFARQIREILGLDNYDHVEVELPQFTGTDGRRIYYFPKTVEEFNKLKEIPDELLLDIGLGRWEKTGNKIHYLYPDEWYDFIPDGMEVVNILG
jgi:hypothetical protein